MASVKEDTVNGVIWSGIERFTHLGIRFVIDLILARLLTPADFGAVAMLGIFFSISNAFIDSGFGKALIRKLDRKEEDFTTVFIFNVLVSLLFYCIMWGIAPWVAEFFHIGILCSVLRVQSVCLIFNGLMAVLNAKLTIALDFKAMAERSLISSLLSGGVGIFMAYHGFGVWSLVYQALAFSLSNLVFVWFYCRWIPKLVFSWASFKEMGTFGSRLMAAGLLHTIYANMTSLVIGRFYTPKDLGYYRRGSEFSRMPNTIILDILQKVAFPVFSKIQNDDIHLISVYRKYIKITSLFIIFFCMLMAALAKPLILFLISEKWIASVIYLQLFCFGSMFNHINTINLSLLQVKGRSDLFLRLEIVKKIIAVLILVASIPLGVLAICISKIIYNQIAIVINTYYSGKLFGMGYFSQVKDFIGYFFLSLLSCVPAYLISKTELALWVQLSAGTIASIAFYFLFLWKDTVLREVAIFLKHRYIR